LRYRFEKVNIILPITDRKSFAHDVHALARLGRQVCVVLIGEDRLEANVGFTVPLRIIKQRIACGNAGACSLPLVDSLALRESAPSH
jgi:hypothetical protein